MAKNTQEYEEGLKVAIDFLKGEIQQYCNPKTLFRKKPLIFTIIVNGFDQYTDDIIKWLKDNYSFDEITYILKRIENAKSSPMQERTEQESNNSSVADEHLDELMTGHTSDMEENESDSSELIGELEIEDDSYSDID